MHVFECLSRFKNVELYEDYVNKLREEKHRKTQAHRADLLRLWVRAADTYCIHLLLHRYTVYMCVCVWGLQKEREAREAAEAAARREYYGARAERLLREEERRLLQHAAALLQEARQHQRPERPLHRAVDVRHSHKYLTLLYPSPLE